MNENHRSKRLVLSRWIGWDRWQLGKQIDDPLRSRWRIGEHLLLQLLYPGEVKAIRPRCEEEFKELTQEEVHQTFEKLIVIHRESPRRSVFKVN